MAHNVEPGTYRLTANVVNPSGDRRTHDRRRWTSIPSWDSGSWWLVKTAGDGQLEIKPAGAWDWAKIPPPLEHQERQMAALLPFLEKLPQEPPTCLLEREYADAGFAGEVLNELAANGEISLSDVIRAAEAIIAREQENR